MHGGTRHKRARLLAQPTEHPPRSELHRENRPESEVDQQQRQMRNNEERRLDEVANGETEPPAAPTDAMRATETPCVEIASPGMRTIASQPVKRSGTRSNAARR